ncbi:hypothetical protein MAR_037947 [Mya arenaria]|uniref:Uncharacterized protein n=1 Tax=Mya arenaria TaxID=6604 RepID=A0ABY7FTX5_MYAAR|nr:hypothetical protein MAR_037947 [Mya arenaria]
MVSINEFSLDNISFVLWTEVVKWFNCSSTTRMRYSSDTKLFWKLGWRIFGTRFVHFMGGFKSHGDKILKMADKGYYSPASSENNFAGSCLTYDGTKIKQGYDKGTPLKDKQDNLKNELSSIDQMVDLLVEKQILFSGEFYNEPLL